MSAVLKPDPDDKEEVIAQDEYLKAKSSDPPYKKARHNSSEINKKQQDANPSEDVILRPFQAGFEKAGDEPGHELDSAEEREKNHPKYKTPNELDTAA